jgi:hypothetical protein
MLPESEAQLAAHKLRQGPQVSDIVLGKFNKTLYHCTTGAKRKIH